MAQSYACHRFFFSSGGFFYFFKSFSPFLSCLLQSHETPDGREKTADRDDATQDAPSGEDIPDVSR